MANGDFSPGNFADIGYAAEGYDAPNVSVPEPGLASVRGAPFVGRDLDAKEEAAMIGLGWPTGDAATRAAIGRTAAVNQDNAAFAPIMSAGLAAAGGPLAIVPGMLSRAGRGFGGNTPASIVDSILGRVDPQVRGYASSLYGEQGPAIAKEALDAHYADRMAANDAIVGDPNLTNEISNWERRQAEAKKKKRLLSPGLNTVDNSALI